MLLSNEALSEIVKHSAEADEQLSEGTLRELADLAEVSPDEVIQAHQKYYDKLREVPAMPSISITPFAPTWRK